MKKWNLSFIIGARTDTAEFDKDLLWKLNTEYSMQIWEKCISHTRFHWYMHHQQQLMALANLAMTTMKTTLGRLKPLNPYGESKNEFDKWVLDQEKKPFFWTGLKFFNVYGPNEYHIRIAWLQ
jgi:ADP-L-glycero-D-manno-heptose 6-epimerase